MTNLAPQLDRTGVTSGSNLAAPILAALVGVLAASLVAPVFALRFPVFADYPEHMARMWVIKTLDHDPLLQRFYAIHWQLLPNMAMDLLVPPAIGVFGLAGAGKLFYLTTLALVLTGVHAVNAALFKRLSLWPLVGFLFIHNRTFDGGLLNYVFAVGLSLWAFAIWVWLRERGWGLRLAVSFLLSAALYTAHLFGLAFYGLLVMAFEAWRLYESGAGGTGRLATDLAAFALPFLAALHVLVMGSTGDQSSEILWDSYGKLLGLYGVLTTYDDPLEIAVKLIAIAGILWALWAGHLRLHPIAWIVLAVAAVIYPTMPTMMFGSWGADARFPAGLCFVLIGLAQWRMPGSAQRVAFCAALVALYLVNDAVAAAAWRGQSAYEADLFRSFERIEPGSRVLVTRERDSGMGWSLTMSYVHGPSLAIIDRSVLVSNVYSHPGHHILVVKPPYRAISDGSEDPPPVIDDVVAADATPGGAGKFYSTWRQSYDYVYVLFAKPDAAPPSDHLAPLYTGRLFQLYRVIR